MMTQNAWIRFPQPNPQARLRLFCFPYAGGGAALFRGWPAALPGTIEVCPIQLPGREDRLREAPFDRLDVLVQVLRSVMWPYLDKPFAFFGHSMGALISYELARQLSHRPSLVPTRLLVAGQQAPQLPAAELPLHSLPAPQFLAEIHRRYDSISEAVWQDAEFMALLLPLLRADFTLVETFTYTNATPLPCPISAFGGLEDTSVSQQGLEAWREQTQGAFKLRMLPGNHFFLNQNTNDLCAAIAQDLTNDQSSIVNG